MLNHDDYTMPLEAVIKAEKPTGEAKAKLELESFRDWAELNQEAISAIWSKAHELAHKRGRISANYLTHWLREEWDGSKVALGDKPYKVPNEFSPILGRYLKADPELGTYIRCNQSQYDQLELPELRRH